MGLGSKTLHFIYIIHIYISAYNVKVEKGRFGEIEGDMWEGVKEGMGYEY